MRPSLFAIPPCATPRPSRGRSAIRRSIQATLWPTIFRRPVPPHAVKPRRDPGSGLSIARQNSRPLRSFAHAAAPRCRSGCQSSPSDGFVAMKAAAVAVQRTELPMSEHDEFEPDHISSPTDHVLTELQLYGFHPRDDEPFPPRAAEAAGVASPRHRRRWPPPTEQPSTATSHSHRSSRHRAEQHPRPEPCSDRLGRRADRGQHIPAP